MPLFCLHDVVSTASASSIVSAFYPILPGVFDQRIFTLERDKNAPRSNSSAQRHESIKFGMQVGVDLNFLENWFRVNDILFFYVTAMFWKNMRFKFCT